MVPIGTVINLDAEGLLRILIWMKFLNHHIQSGTHCSCVCMLFLVIWVLLPLFVSLSALSLILSTSVSLYLCVCARVCVRVCVRVWWSVNDRVYVVEAVRTYLNSFLIERDKESLWKKFGHREPRRYSLLFTSDRVIRFISSVYSNDTWYMIIGGHHVFLVQPVLWALETCVA